MSQEFNAITNKIHQNHQKARPKSSIVREIHALTSKMDRLLRTGKEKPKRKPVNKRRTSSRRDPLGGRDSLRTAAGISTSIISHPAVAAGDPLAVAIAAQVSPFSVPKCIAKKPFDPKPSQAITARGTNTWTIGAGSTIVFAVSPCVASDSTCPSVTAVISPSGSLSSATSTWTSSTAAVAPAGCSLATLFSTTPYATSTLTGNDYQWRLVGCGLRIRNVSEALYRGGLLRYVADESGTMNSTINLSSTTLQGIMDQIGAAQHSVRKHFSDTSLIEIMVPVPTRDWVKDQNFVFSAADTYCPGSVTSGTYDSPYNTRFGGTTSTIVCGAGPQVWGYFTNGSSGSQTIDVELVEHWEVHSASLSMLHTPGVAHLQSQALVDNVVAHVTSQHGMNPHLHFKDVVKEGVKLAHNKQAVKDASLAASIMLAL